MKQNLSEVLVEMKEAGLNEQVEAIQAMAIPTGSTEEKILRVLESQRFKDWYDGEFQAYIEGDEPTNPAEVREKMLATIKRMFNV